MLDDTLHPDEEPKPVSMSMTKAELLDRLHECEDDLTKAEILERIRMLEEGEGDPEPEAPAMPMSTETRSATIDGVVYTWTASTDDQVPQVAREVWAQSHAMGA